MSAAYKHEKARYLQHYQPNTDKRSGRDEQMRMTPLLSLSVKHAVDEAPTSSLPLFNQYGFLGCDLHQLDEDGDPEPILFNVDAPNSTFICGSQGSGKSYTLSCMLENCLIKNKNMGRLVTPVGAVVFHYDLDSAGSVAEAAGLCSKGIKVRVLVSQSNKQTLEATYKALRGANKHLEVLPLMFRDTDLDTASIRRLMAFSGSEGSVPLYMEVLEQILRDMAIKGMVFRFSEFEAKLKAERFSEGQKSMLYMRLNLLKSFMSTTAADVFTAAPGTLTVVDLSDPFVDRTTACALFDICLGMFTRKKPESGLVIALDEAHKYLTKSDAAAAFIQRLEGTVRTQRHCATRVIIATQEPTISGSLLDLCSTCIVHHFKSPAWFAAIRGHLVGASGLTTTEKEQQEMFQQIVELDVGEALVFSPSSFVHVDAEKPKKLGSGVMKMKTRKRMAMDLGKSDMASLH